MQMLCILQEELGKELHECVVVYFQIGVEKVEGDVNEGGD